MFKVALMCVKYAGYLCVLIVKAIYYLLAFVVSTNVNASFKDVAPAPHGWAAKPYWPIISASPKGEYIVRLSRMKGQAAKNLEDVISVHQWSSKTRSFNLVGSCLKRDRFDLESLEVVKVDNLGNIFILNYSLEFPSKQNLVAIDCLTDKQVTHFVSDDGTELFGEGTKLLSLSGIQQKANHGYSALAQYDLEILGGNSDGKISPKDQVWKDLLVWVDKNADGESNPNELKSLSYYSIRKIALKYKTHKNGGIDSSLNERPYSSWVHLKKNGGPNRVRMIDIFFRIIE